MNNDKKAVQDQQRPVWQDTWQTPPNNSSYSEDD